MLYPLIVFALGWLRQGVTWLRVGAVVTTFAVSFTILQPLVAHARIVQYIELGSPTAGTLEQRWQILSSFFDPAGDVAGASEVQTNITRFTYVTAATFVINRFDRGQPGESLNNALVIFIPRFLWPEKPIYTPGGDLAFLVSGEEGNSISAGLFAEAYWCYGWWGIPLLMIPLGIILTLASRYALNVMQRGEWIYLPALLMAVKMGIRVDGQYVNDVVGATAILLFLHGACFVLGHSFGLHARADQRSRRA